VVSNSKCVYMPRSIHTLNVMYKLPHQDECCHHTCADDLSNGIIIPPPNFAHESNTLYYQLQVITLYNFGLASNGMTSVVNSMKIYFSIPKCIDRHHLTKSSVSGVVVSVLATGPKGCRFKPSQSDGFLRAIKIRSTPFFGWYVKLEVLCSKILWHVEKFSRYFR
jgi:hypothetical protein